MDRKRLLEDAEEFQQLVAWLMETADIDKESAESAVIHSGHKRLEEILTAYIKARSDNARQLGGLTDRILKDE